MEPLFVDQQQVGVGGIECPPRGDQLPQVIFKRSLETDFGDIERAKGKDFEQQEPARVDGVFQGDSLWMPPTKLGADAYCRPRHNAGHEVPVEMASIWRSCALGASSGVFGFDLGPPVDQPAADNTLRVGYMPGTFQARGCFQTSSIPSDKSTDTGEGDSEDQADLAEEHNIDCNGVSTTTVMVQNIPRQLTRQKVMSAMQADGFGDCFDYCYVPRCFESKMNKGYAFVNFINEEMANAFKQSFDRTFKLGTVQRRRSKPIRVTPAVLQGYTRNSAFAGSKKICRIRNGEYRPLVCN